MEDYSAFTLDGRVNTTLEVFLNQTYNVNTSTTAQYGTYEGDTFFDPDQHRDPFYVVIPITIIYVIIFVTGFVGNISTCIVISRNKSMHTATNYYLFSLAVSDFMLLISGVPMELYHIWYKQAFIFGEVFCILRNAINEMSANATVLTITAFTIERYVAICHPFLSHTMSKLSRAIKFIFFIWILSIFFATPLAIQTGIVTDPYNPDITVCSIVPHKVLIEDSFVIATVLFFFAPMTLISILYMLIGMKLRSSTLIKRENGNVVRNNNLQSNIQGTSQSTKRVIKMLVAVVICFFLSWFPFHAQRLVFMYVTFSGNQDSETMHAIYTYTTYISGVLYYVSTCINPILYNLMSNKFRQAFKETLQKRCCTCSASPQDHQKRQYRMLQRNGKRGRWHIQSEPSEYSGSGKDDYYSSSTQKQSIETITTSRNTSVKQLSKLHTDNNFIIKSPSVIEMATVTSRFPHIINENDVACLSKVVSGSEINIYSDDCVQEIQLNIFPPSAAYTSSSHASHHCHAERVSRCKYCGVSAGNGSGVASADEANCLSIDVIQDSSSKSGGSSSSNGGGSNETEECHGKSLQGQFSHIAFKRSNSILHISIGKSSKIVKRRKRKWLFAKIFNRKKEFHSPDGKVLHLNSLSAFNVINDNMIICINKKNRQSTTTTAANTHQHLNNEIYQNQLRSILDGDLEYGANELDFYMNEIKSREMG